MPTKIKARSRHGIATMALILLLGVGCSRPVNVPSDAAFQASSGRPASAQPSDASFARGESSASAKKLPFREQENLPAGTLISVRLSRPISIAGSTENSSFEAVVVDPVVVEGATLIPQGTPVTGRVESVRTSQLKPNRGYVRLALASVHAGGIDVPVQTASLFARQSPSVEQSSSMIGLEKGRRLTFSLSEAVYIANSRAKTDH